MSEDMSNEVQEHEIEDVSDTEAEAIEQEFDADRSARFETIRQMALSGELEYAPESEEIVEALIETIAQRDENFGRFQSMAAEHQNFQRRASLNENEARISSRQGVVQALIPLLDHFEMAGARIIVTWPRTVLDRQLETYRSKPTPNYVESF